MNTQDSDDGWTKVKTSKSSNLKPKSRNNHSSFAANDVKSAKQEIDANISNVAQQVDFVFKYAPLTGINQFIVFGLGQPSKMDLACRDSRIQSAFIVSLKQRCSLQCSVYDPLFTSFDAKLMSFYGIKELSNVADCRFKCRSPTLIFCPHLPWSVLKNVIDANLQNLSKLILISNDIRSFNVVSDHILMSYRIPSCKEHPRAFSDTFLFWWRKQE